MLGYEFASQCTMNVCNCIVCLLRCNVHSFIWTKFNNSNHGLPTAAGKHY